jgi:hypothetical protein
VLVEGGGEVGGEVERERIGRLLPVPPPEQHAGRVACPFAGEPRHCARLLRGELGGAGP